MHNNIKLSQELGGERGNKARNNTIVQSSNRTSSNKDKLAIQQTQTRISTIMGIVFGGEKGKEGNLRLYVGYVFHVRYIYVYVVRTNKRTGILMFINLFIYIYSTPYIFSINLLPLDVPTM